MAGPGFGASKQWDALPRAATLSGRRRVSVAFGVRAVAALCVAWVSPWQFAFVVGWSATALTVVGGTWSTVGRFDPNQTARWATREDDTRTGAEALLVGAAAASLIGIAFGMLKAKQGSQAWELLLTWATVLAIVSPWALVHTIFTLRYAALYYGSDPIGGIDFKAKGERPDCGDFAYTAFTVGMTFQVSDTDITNRPMRRTVLCHALLSFLFGAVILATTVNVVASLLSQ